MGETVTQEKIRKSPQQAQVDFPINNGKHKLNF